MTPEEIDVVLNELAMELTKVLAALSRFGAAVKDKVHVAERHMNSEQRQRLEALMAGFESAVDHLEGA